MSSSSSLSSTEMMSSSDKPLRIFAIGLGKTGTTSLTTALDLLGIKTIHYPHDKLTYEELRNCRFRLSILEEYSAIADISIAPYYAQLDKAYPGSKFILTVREKASWLRSMEQHRRNVLARWEHDPPYQKRFDEFINACVYGCAFGVFSTERFSYVYDTHVRNVREYFAGRADDLLTLDICAGEGWEKLCPFLGVTIPGAPFPQENRSFAPHCAENGPVLQRM